MILLLSDFYDNTFQSSRTNLVKLDLKWFIAQVKIVMLDMEINVRAEGHTKFAIQTIMNYYKQYHHNLFHQFDF